VDATPTPHTPQRPRTRTVLIAFLLCLPTLVFVTANVLAFELGRPGIYAALEPVIAPASELLESLMALLVILGPLAALALIASELLRADVDRRADGAVLLVEIRLAWRHLTVAALAICLLGAIGLYLFLENARVRFD
jgi:hypothetical protein